MWQCSNWPGLMRALLANHRSHLPMAVSVAGGTLLAILVSWKFLSPPISSFVVMLAVLMAMVVVIDARFFIIPNTLNLLIFGIGFVFWTQASATAELSGYAGAEPNLLSKTCDILARSIVSGGALLAVREAFYRVRGVDGLGLGDIKLAAASGPWLAWDALPMALQLAVFLAVLMIVVGALARRRMPKRTDVLPFGTCLAPAIWIAFTIEHATIGG